MTAIEERVNAQSNEEGKITPSSGNVYKDLGLSHPDERLAKSVIASAITDTIKARKLTQAVAAELIGTNRPKISELQRGRLTHFTIDRLIRFANALGIGVHVTVRNANDEQGRASTHATI